MNKLFILSFENGIDQETCRRYYLPTVDRKEFNVMVDGRSFFDQPKKQKKDWITYDNIRKLANDQGDDYAAGSLLDYRYFESIILS